MTRDDQRVIQETLLEAQRGDSLGMEISGSPSTHFDGICADVEPVPFAAALCRPARSRSTCFGPSARFADHTRIRLAEPWPSIDNIKPRRSRGRARLVRL